MHEISNSPWFLPGPPTLQSSFGCPAAEMGLMPEEAGAYAKTVVATDLRPGGVLAKVAADIAANGLAHGEDAIRRKMEELLPLAEEQVKAGI